MRSTAGAMANVFVAWAFASSAAHAQPATLSPPLIARFSEQCIVAPKAAAGSIPESVFGAVAGLLVPKLVGGVVDWTKHMLTKAGESRQTSRSVSAGGYFYRIPSLANARPETRNCLQVIVPGDTGASWTDLTGDAGTGARVRSALKLTELPGPSFFLELAIVESADGEYFRFVPTFLRVLNAFSGSPRRMDLVVAITMQAAGEDKPFASSTVSIGGVRPGRTGRYELAALVGHDSAWNSKPAYSPSLQSRLGPKSKPEAGLFVPVNVTVGVTQTQDGNKLLQALATSVGDVQKDIVTAVAGALPTEANRVAAETINVDNRNAFAEAVAGALAAIEEEKVALLTRTQAGASAANATGEEKAKLDLAAAAAEAAFQAKRAATIKAKGAANKAAIKANVASPFPEIYP